MYTVYIYLMGKTLLIFENYYFSQFQKKIIFNIIIAYVRKVGNLK